MPVVNVNWLAGRTTDQKRLIVERVTSAMEEVGVAPSGLHIVFTDVEREDWAVGGKLFSDQ